MSAVFAEHRRIIGFRYAAADIASGPKGDATEWQVRSIMIFLAIGVVVRLIRYLLRFPLWGDEAMLAINFIDRDYASLMRPLVFHQVSPLLFLWTELSAVKLLGFNEWSLRLFPLVCSIVSLFLFHRLARLVLRGTALVLAVGIFAVTYSGIRYAAEVKPYSVDQMVSVLIVWLAVRWWQHPGETRWLWALTAVVPLALGMSYPAVFVAGGVSMAVAAVLIGTRSRRSWPVWGIYNLALVASFVGWYMLSIGVQAGAELGVMTRMWDDTFPPRDSLMHLLQWLMRVHAGPLFAVPVGGNNWGSIGTTLFCFVAVAVLIRNGSYRLLVLCATPFALNLLAAAMRRFPYGGHMRLTMHLAPLICILMGIGMTAVFRWLAPKQLTFPLFRRVGESHSQRLTWPVAVSVFLLLLLAVLSTGRDFYLPGKEQQEIRKRDFAVWFWGSMERDHEVLDIGTDLKKVFTPKGDNWENCVSSQFICNAQIYSPRRVRGKPCDFCRVSRERPLACVQYWSHCSPYDEAAFRLWLDGMKQQYDLVATERYPMLQDNDDDRAPEPPDHFDVYEFTPKQVASERLKETSVASTVIPAKQPAVAER